MKVLDIYEAKTTIQTFDDAKLERPLARIFMYDDAKCKELNNQGAGIFWTINPQEKDNHRGVETTFQFSCLGMDCDVAKEADEKKGIIRPAEEQIESLKTDLFNNLITLPIPPSGIIETKNGLQPYWVFIDPQSIKVNQREQANIRYQDYLRGVTKVTGIRSEGDNIQRVLRLPGYYHKKSEPAFLIRDIFEEGKACKFEDFKNAYPPVTKYESQRPTKKYEPTGKPTHLEDIPVQQALETLSGMAIVDHEEYTFRPNSNGTIQIIINNKASGQWIDPQQNTIGGSGEGKGNPTIIQWLAWYYMKKGDTHDIAYAKSYRSLWLLLLPELPEEQIIVSKKKNNNETIVIPEIDAHYIAKMLTDPEFSKGVMTQYAELDGIIKGLKKQFLYGIIAASGQGKSVFAVNILYNIAKQGYPVGYLDLENGPIMGEKRLLQIHTGWDTKQIESLEKTDKDFIAQSIKDMEQEIKFYRLYDLEVSHAKRQHIKAIEIITYLVKEKGVRVVCIDNVNCFISDARNENEYKSELYVAFSKLAIDLDISIIIIHHATDKLDKKMGYTEEDIRTNTPKLFQVPFLSKALGTSTFVEKINVGITFAYKLDVKQIWCSVDKNRDGMKGFFFLYFHDNNLRITNALDEKELYEKKTFVRDNSEQLHEEDIEKPTEKITKDNKFGSLL